ncbi:MAG: TetR/AcrR family transcriptional regulator [Mesorhizobium sp.]|uniref:TetR/AcrR family transcriptional regulator n=1 Tax=Mesorhizobium sp. TaxID=1871066 RepID=UPI0012213243|nr:TetR/AcrR family transcriptional regulator [Mesorhizobium sp.]TIO52352.1 MAG: TetR/AcrR family transcriptional regulator [Mesorhizobium sp.]TIO61238.1 MAG: TetR/AcrR family transcriptional regulator [Mesorhizobium sp.]TJV66073.1 MAG: TetR/AcrR family transcriptional regulator [Mesorhizobium sp.]
MKLKDEKKLDAVIAATCRLAAERGLFGLTLAEIAKAAGIGTSTLYVYFADKEALFNEVFRRAKRDAVDFYGGEVDATAPLKARVRGVWTRMLDHRLRWHDEVSFMEQFVGSSFMSDESRAYSSRLSDGLMQIVTEGQGAELLKAVPAPFLTSLFIGSVRETARLIRAGAITDTEESRAIAFQLCWDGIRS